MRRVVVTGLGAVTPLGVGLSSCLHTMYPFFSDSFDSPTPGIRKSWKKLINSHCGIQSTIHLGDNYGSIPSQVAGLVPVGGGQDGRWKASDWLTKEVQSCMADRGALV